MRGGVPIHLDQNFIRLLRNTLYLVQHDDAEHRHALIEHAIGDLSVGNLHENRQISPTHHIDREIFSGHHFVQTMIGIVDALPVQLVVSVVIDRFAGFVALVVLTAFTVPMLTAYKNMLIPDEVFWAVGLSFLLVGILLLSLRWSASTPAFRRIPRLGQVQTALRAVRPTKEGLLLFAAIGLGTNMTVIISAFLLGRELNPLMDLYSCFAILPLVSLLTFIPISIAGWGVREALMMSAFSLIDVPATDALAVSIKLGLANLALGLIGGIVWILLPAKDVPGEAPS